MEVAQAGHCDRRAPDGDAHYTRVVPVNPAIAASGLA